ncbi:MAG TPA: hypothetical protein VKN36_14095 [Eudoraea sp.]|nr:hypothetical protein [Eudoraea sp.]
MKPHSKYLLEDRRSFRYFNKALGTIQDMLPVYNNTDLQSVTDHHLITQHPMPGRYHQTSGVVTNLVASML